MLTWTCIVILYFTATAANDVNIGKDQDWLEVKISQGVVRGHKDKNGNMYAFYNIPYATAPTGDNKFKAPLPPPTWTKTYDAVGKGIICPQYTLLDLKPEKFIMQENCLIANVYVPNIEKKNLTVYVYVHGGGYQVGHTEELKLKHFVNNKDIILVKFSYRLGIRGFLCLGTDDIPGNAGMKDQVALLRWVQQNIAAFGGNPNDVTIGGYSAGSSSVDLLMLSKSAEGLFHKVIPESGASLAGFAVQPDPLQNAKDYAKKLNFFDVDDINALEQFYKNMTYDALKADSFWDITDSTVMFEPCVERNTSEAFLTESPLSILKSGHYKKLPMLYGFSNMDGLLRLDFFNTMWNDKMNSKFSDFLPGELKFNTEHEKEEVAKQVKRYYFGDKCDNVLRFVDYFTDVMFSYPTLRAVKLHAEAGHDQVYLYEYSFVDDDTPVIPYTDVRGAGHCAQSIAVADGISFTNSIEDYISVEYKSMKKIMREIWYNFIKTGKPESSSLPTWPAAGADASPHMSLGRSIELRDVLSINTCLFWDNIYQKYYREPIPPQP